MNWIYYDPETETANSRSRTLYVRPIHKVKRKKMVLGSITQIKVYALDYFFRLPNNPFRGNEYRIIYDQELNEKPFFVRENSVDVQRKNYLHHSLTVFLKTDSFSEADLLKWCRFAISEQGYRVEGIEAEKIEKFKEILPENRHRISFKQRLFRLFL